MFIQTDSRWMFDDMGMEGDKIWRWGCLITSLSNILTEFKGVDITPQDVNNKLRDNKGYARLADPKCPENIASNLLWDKAEEVFGFKKRDNVPYDCVSGVRFIARILHPMTGAGHYINVISKDDTGFICFDVEHGDTRHYNNQEIMGLIWIEKL